MAESVLTLTGCRPRPLLGYLKALGVLRIAGVQIDSRVCGRWHQDVFELRSPLDGEMLEDFLLDRYVPDPIVSPWNGGSGFFPKDDTRALEAIEASTSERLEPFRRAIAAGRATLSQLGIETKPDPKEQKPRLLRALRGALPDAALPWLDASAIVLGQEKTHFPPLLGSGGNDGRYDFANNYAQAIVRVLDRQGKDRELSRRWLHGALTGGSTPLQKSMSLGHLARDKSPTNSPHGESDALGNPWDLIIALEGTLVLVAGAARRNGSALQGAMVAPFTAVTTGAGYGSAVEHEKGRAELWLPLWPQWATLAEIESLARESRAQVGRRQARDGLDFVRAAAEIGVARGIESFERYAILERAGQSSLAVSAGRIDVKERPAVAALRLIDHWLDHLRRYARSDNCPTSHAEAASRLDRALFDFADSGTPQDAGRVLERLSAVESALAQSGERVAEALMPLRGAPADDWLAAGDDGSAEFALAAAIASLHDGSGSLPAVRDYLHGTGLDERGRRTYAADGPARIPQRADAITRLAALHARRHLDAARADRKNLSFDHGLPTRAWLPSALATETLDAERVIRLTGGLSLFDYASTHRRPKPKEERHVDPVFGVLALAWQAREVSRLVASMDAETSAGLGPRPGWTARLAANHAQDVIREAVLRLRMAGLGPLMDADDLPVPANGAAVAAALLVRVSRRDLRPLARRFLTLETTPPSEGVTS